MAMTSSAFCNLDTAKTMDVSLAFRREVQTEAARLRKGFIYPSFVYRAQRFENTSIITTFIRIMFITSVPRYCRREEPRLDKPRCGPQVPL
jgi:hypothetical protein